MLQILSLVLTLGSVICFIIVLIKLFQNEGALKGILGLICSLYTFIWGWMNATKLNIKNIMMIWTALIILCIILSFMGGGFQYSIGTPPATP
jgi:hypothetical protein